MASSGEHKIVFKMKPQIENKMKIIMKPIVEVKKIYYGEINCQLSTKKPVKACNNLAYYLLEGKYVCGVHSQKFKNERIELPVNPDKEINYKATLLAHQTVCDQTAVNNAENKLMGHVICYKMLMLKSVPLTPKYINIFPNFKHGSRRDGIGMPSLSPKSIGPIDHGQPGLPIALNLENFHQGMKVFSSEVDDKGMILPIYYQTRKEMFEDPIPHRHKVSSGQLNVPLYSIWVTKSGVEKKMSYFESRQFYCHFYEKHVNQLSDFHKLVKMIEAGYNLQICGYDGYPITKTNLVDHYRDTSRPFGHELVLYCMLMKSYPWHAFKTEIF